MKKLGTYCWLILLFLVAACTKKDKVFTGTLEPSYGNRNEVVLVIDDSLWIGALGDSIRAKLAQPTPGLTKQEPIFDLLQLDPKIFSTKAKTARNIVLFSVNTAHEFALEKSLNATPQNFFFVRARTTSDLIRLFDKKADSIISVFNASELNEEMHQIVRSGNRNTQELKDFFGCTLSIPSAYHLQIENEFPFLWYQKDLSSGNLNLILYEFPIAEIENNQATVEEHLLQARDFIGSEFLKTAKDAAYVTTTQNASLHIFETTVQDLPVYRISGKWETVNDYMTGPFVCYAIRDDYYKRYLFIEGFVNNPFKDKRNQLLEMEAIIKTINFNENSN